MRILINCSNLKAGGGLQVADSVCGWLYNYPQHSFIVVLSPYMAATSKRLQGVSNVEVFSYGISNSIKTVLFGRDSYLDTLVMEKKVDAVLTIFGPSRWRPKAPHLSGFALPQLVTPESPYFKRMSVISRMRWQLWGMIRKWSLKRSADYFWTESTFISSRLKVLFGIEEVYTISNFYNQIYDQPGRWLRNKALPPFSGITCLSISAHYPHKNFEIVKDIILSLREKHPGFKVRFVFTFDESEMPMPRELMDSMVFVGRIDISECPFLYEQSDIMLMPSLLECFTATYPEAMRMGVPIVTTDLPFARSICGEAACFYDALDANDAAEAIFKVALDKEYRDRLVKEGVRQLDTFCNSEQRVEKLIGLLEMIQKRENSR